MKDVFQKVGNNPSQPNGAIARVVVESRPSAAIKVERIELTPTGRAALTVNEDMKRSL